MSRPNGMFDRRGPGTTFVIIAILLGTLAISVGVRYFSSDLQDRTVKAF